MIKKIIYFEYMTMYSYNKSITKYLQYNATITMIDEFHQSN